MTQKLGVTEKTDFRVGISIEKYTKGKQERDIRIFGLIKLE